MFHLICKRPALLVCFAVVAATALCGTPALAAEACPNEQVRAEQGSTHLPGCRAYEKLSPAFKGGYGAEAIDGVEPGGEAVAFASRGVFAGQAGDEALTDYEAVRSGAGWSTVALMPAASFAPAPALMGFSPSLGASLWELNPGVLNHSGLSSELQFAAHVPGAPGTQAGFQDIGPSFESFGNFNQPFVAGEPVSMNKEGFSADLCHVIIVPSAVALLPEAVGAAPQLYDISGCGAPGIRMVAVTNSGSLLAPNCSPYLGHAASSDKINAISADGEAIYFSVNEPNNSGCEGERTTQLFVRLGGERTLEVSKPLGEVCVEVPCPGADTRAQAVFQGASEDGSRVFFTTGAPLTGGTDTSSNLYMAEVGCPGGASGCEAAQRVVTGLVAVSHDPHVGQSAEVQGVVGVAPDGSRVYFIARGVLSETANQQGAVAADGADNLYVYDEASGQTTFVGDLCSGAESSGVAGDVACPDDLEASTSEGARNDTELWLEFPHSSAQTAGGDGRFLVFSTYARLVTSGPEADADDAQDVYRYDAQTGGLQRVSVGEGGEDANGNRNDGEPVVGAIDHIPARAGDARIALGATNEIDQEERGGDRSAVSEDGSRIVFMTAEPLSLRATNGLVNVYEWHEGAVSLVSCGCSSEPDADPVITPSGRDLFFKTSAGLVAGDTDGAPDLYDARIGGGFPVSEAPVARCEGDACQGPLTNPAPLLVPGSAVQAPGENTSPVPTVAAGVKSSPKKKVKKKKVRKKRKAKGKPGKSRAKKSAKGRR